LTRNFTSSFGSASFGCFGSANSLHT